MRILTRAEARGLHGIKYAGCSRDVGTRDLRKVEQVGNKRVVQSFPNVAAAIELLNEARAVCQLILIVATRIQEE